MSVKDEKYRVLNNLKEIRMRKYMMSKRDFSKVLGIQEQQYLRYESGNSLPSLKICLMISNKLEILINEIWYLEENITNIQS